VLLLLLLLPQTNHLFVKAGGIPLLMELMQQDVATASHALWLLGNLVASEREAVLATQGLQECLVDTLAKYGPSTEKNLLGGWAGSQVDGRPQVDGRSPAASSVDGCVKAW